MEAANEGLRADAQTAAGKLRAAYEQEAALLAELGRLSEQMRQQQHQTHRSSHTSPARGAVTVSAGGQQQQRATMDDLTRDLFMAAATQMMHQFENEFAQVGSCGCWSGRLGGEGALGRRL